MNVTKTTNEWDRNTSKNNNRENKRYRQVLLLPRISNLCNEGFGMVAQLAAT